MSALLRRRALRRPTRCSARSTRLLARRARDPAASTCPSCGSVFKNPPGDFAGRLIEAAGLKGHRVGGAQISPVHANFIANTGGATAADVLALIRRAQERVREHRGTAAGARGAHRREEPHE